jgi:hypothetical protein
VRRLFAAMLLERGGAEDAARARGYIEEAARAYAAMGMPGFESLARSMSDPIA